MNTRNPRTIVLLLTLTALAVGVSPARGLDPLVELEQKREEEAKRRDSNTPGPKAADELLANQDWRNRMATQIALAIEACRYTGPLKELEARAEALNAKDPNGAATVAANRAVQAEQEKIQMADSARGRVTSLIGSLEMLQDPRVVPLIAPALRETSPTTYHGDYIVHSPQRTAGNILFSLAVLRVITVANRPDPHDAAGWGKWWDENKLNFDEVPEPLKAIEEGRITKTFDPNSVAPAKTVAQAEAKKPQEAPAVAPATPPQATPDKPAPAVATAPVTRSGETSIWFPIAAASTAILLAAGIWFYSRTSRA